MRAMILIALLAWVPGAWAQEQKSNTAGPQAKDKAAPADAMHPRVKMETTLGDIVLELDAEKAPISVDNFIRYANDGFYEGTIFHRVMPDFMIQGGGFTEEMEKKKGLRPPIKNEWNNGLKNVNGTIAMARLGAPDSATAQFFINVKNNPALDQPRGGAAYAVFGKVVEGANVVETIRTTEVHSHPKYPSRDGAVTPVVPVVIKSVTLISEYDQDTVTARVAAVEEQQRQERAREEAAKGDRANAFKNLLETGQDENGRKLQKTESGVQYVVLQEGDGPSPDRENKVTLHYTGWLLNGSEFDSSVKKGRPLTMKLGNFVPGFTEGVGLMKAGGKRLLIIPSHLAYKDRGRPGIPPNSDLVFEVELLKIN